MGLYHQFNHIRINMSEEMIKKAESEETKSGITGLAKRIRFYMGLWSGKLSVIVMRLMKRHGSVLPGQVALKICPDFLSMTSYPEKIISVTGTNGKTTVANMLIELLTRDGHHVLSNSSGANTKSGICAMFVNGLSFCGKCRHDICVYEIDEKWTKIIFPIITPHILAVTNLSCDSISRNAHPAYIRDILNDAIPSSTTLVLNADNRFTAFLAPDNRRVYFGVDLFPSDSSGHAGILLGELICPDCGHYLVWDKLHYSEAGRVHCPHCGLQSPERDYLCKNIDLKNRQFVLSEEDGEVSCSLPGIVDFNIYNAVTAASVLRVMGYERNRVAELFHGLKIMENRIRCSHVGNTTVYTMYSKVKNAYANSRVFEYLRTIKGEKEVVILTKCMNSGKTEPPANIVWIYDCDYELLNTPELCNIVLYGPYTHDIKLRLLLAGIPENRIRIADTMADVPEKLYLNEDETIFILYVHDYDEAHRIEHNIIKRIKEKLPT